MFNSFYHADTNLSAYSFLITGGAGFIGCNIVEYLLRYNAGKVRVLDNLSTGFESNIAEFRSNRCFEFINGDIRDVSTCKKAVEGIDYISHQAALGSVPRSVNDPVTTNEVNIAGFLNMLIAARDAKVKRFVYATSSSTYGDSKQLPKTEDNIGKPLSPYAVTKYVNELYAAVFSKVYKFNTIGLRYFNVFGPHQSPKGAYAAVIPLFIESSLNNKQPIINGDGETTRDFTFVENAVQANIKAMFATDIENSEVFNIAFGKSVSLNHLWESICRITGNYISPIYKEERKGDIKHSLADISKAKNIIGYNPEISFEQGLQASISWAKLHFNPEGVKFADI